MKGRERERRYIVSFLFSFFEGRKKNPRKEKNSRKEKRKKKISSHPNHDPRPVVQQQAPPERRRRVDVDGEHLGNAGLEHAGHDAGGADAALGGGDGGAVVVPVVVVPTLVAVPFAALVSTFAAEAAPLPEPELVRYAVDLDRLVALEVEHAVGVGPLF